MTSDDLFDYARTVASREDFAKFAEHLREDYKNRPSEWSNNTVEQFLQGLSGFAKDMGGYYKNMGEKVDVDHITWRMAAEMLLAASVYGT